MNPLKPFGAAVRGLLGADAPPQATAQGANSAPLTSGAYMHPTRDAILQFLGGAAGRLDNVLQQHDLQKYQDARIQRVYQVLPDHLRPVFAADPQGFMAQFYRTFSPDGMATGDPTGGQGDGRPQTNGPGLDEAGPRDTSAAKLEPQAWRGGAGARVGGRSTPLAAIHADTAQLIGPDAAAQMLQRSQGDPGGYLDLRDQYFRSLAMRDPNARKRLPVWLKRNADLAGYVQSLPA
jgi:hypothetical protein